MIRGSDFIEEEQESRRTASILSEIAPGDSNPGDCSAALAQFDRDQTMRGFSFQAAVGDRTARLTLARMLRDGVLVEPKT
jgi:hypothetical protein